MDPKELAAIRQHCLKMASDDSPNGTTWTKILELAKRFEDYIVTGKTE